MKTCKTLTREELQSLPAEVAQKTLCPRCIDYGRSGHERHIREYAGMWCPCCRRAYQRIYYKQRRSASIVLANSDPDNPRLKRETPGHIAMRAATIERLREQTKVWYKKGLEKEADEQLLPDLQAMEEEAGIPDFLRTTPRRIRIALIQEDLDRRKAIEGLEEAIRALDLEPNTQTIPTPTSSTTQHLQPQTKQPIPSDPTSLPEALQLPTRKPGEALAEEGLGPQPTT